MAHEGLRIRARLRALYHGASPTAVRFRLAVIVVDFAIIGFFIAAPLLREEGWAYYALDGLIALLLTLDLAARALAQRDIKVWLSRPLVWVDIFILLTLLLPTIFYNFGFLRVLRLWTLLNSEFFWQTVGRRYDDTRVEDIVKSGSALLTFIFVVTGFIYTTYMGRHEGIGGWVDALYFTITSMTTTGYGDITLPGTSGRVISVVVMLLGVSLFIRLIQSVVRPHKVFFPCPVCGLRRHDPDAVHCKACGQTLNIPNDE
jgi:voltage-gated potassium channel